MKSNLVFIHLGTHPFIFFNYFLFSIFISTTIIGEFEACENECQKELTPSVFNVTPKDGE